MSRRIYALIGIVLLFAISTVLWWQSDSQKRATDLFPAPLSIEKIEFAGTLTRSFFIYELSDSTVAKIKDGGVDYLEREVILSRNERRHRLQFRNWYLTPIIEGKDRLISPLPVDIGEDEFSRMAAASSFLNPPKMPKAARASYDKAVQSLDRGGAAIGISKKGEAILLIDLQTRKAVMVWESDY